MKRKNSPWLPTSLGLACGILIAVWGIELAAQTNLVRNRLQLVAMGKSDEVRQELPDLLADFPDDPGVKFLHAVLVDDALRALPLYERIVRDHPTSEWADDAMWRIVQILALRHDKVKARQALADYRERFPQSEFLLYAVETVRMTVGLDGEAMPTVSALRKSEPPAVVEETPPPIASKQPVAPPPASPPPNKALETATNRAAEEGSSPTQIPNDSQAASSASGTRYTLQVGLYSTGESAQAELQRFTQYRMRASIVEKSLNGATKYAVTIGDYSSRESAERARKTVQKYCNCTPFIVARD